LVTIVVPAFNEAANLQSFFRELTSALRVPDGSFSWKVLLIDDGSSDGTWREILELSANHVNVAGLRFARNFGKEAAIEAGLSAARAADACVVIDADLQHPPSLIPEMVKIWQKGGVDVVSAMKTERPDESAVRRAASRAFYWLFGRAAGLDLRKTSDFKLLSRRSMDAYLALPERAKFFRGLTKWLGHPEALVHFRAAERRDGGPSRWSFTGLVRYGWNTVLSFSGMPLRIVRYVAAGMFVAAVGIGSISLVQKMSGHAVEGFTTVILLLLMIGSAILFALGIIGDYLERIYMEVKGRPSYVIAERVGG
jgi:dolichol-phosphate mannosyltransferase